MIPATQQPAYPVVMDKTCVLSQKFEFNTATSIWMVSPLALNFPAINNAVYPHTPETTIPNQFLLIRLTKEKLLQSQTAKKELKL